MHTLDFIQDLAIIMILAGFITVIFHRFNQPVVLGYILAGVIIGPHTPPFSYIYYEGTIKTLAELGVMFLMFSLGLDFSFKKLKKVGLSSFIAALFEMVVMVFLGYAVGRFFHWHILDSLFLGAMLSISSTIIVVKALKDSGQAHKEFAQFIFGILIVEDILAVVLLTLLPNIALHQNFEIVNSIFLLLKLVLLISLIFISSILVIPRLIHYVAKFDRNEILLISILAVAFAISLLMARLGYSLALGGFVAGAILADSAHIIKISRLVEPIRDLFSAVFFVSVGLLLNPFLLWHYLVPTMWIIGAVLIGKLIASFLGLILSGRDIKLAGKVGLSMAQIGEFSFIIAALGQNLKVTSNFLYPIAVSTSVITTLLTPYFIKHASLWMRSLEKHLPKKWRAFYLGYQRWIGRYIK